MTTSSISYQTKTRRTDAEIAARVTEVNEHERFSVFTFRFRDEHHQAAVLAAGAILVTSLDGSEYIGYVEDWDDNEFHVNLR